MSYFAHVFISDHSNIYNYYYLLSLRKKHEIKIATFNKLNYYITL